PPVLAGHEAGHREKVWTNWYLRHARTRLIRLAPRTVGLRREVGVVNGVVAGENASSRDPKLDRVRAVPLASHDRSVEASNPEPRLELLCRPPSPRVVALGLTHQHGGDTGVFRPRQGGPSQARAPTRDGDGIRA